ncbi:hypothetical protein HWC64_gp068 [Salmonella phage OSY-STA]|uniref:Phage capsid-like C-terminal domain-containing protein n=1 Tax=Salmonella phage OSY-STA TaxID=2596884 RepID=A0A5C2H4I6_9CAUD|nr:hypothetical protein HWC64_gp068 [Salmonella phage OSY-STA]QEP29372.1 hypothetical protein [Salmonella phage OSY-STA]
MTIDINKLKEELGLGDLAKSLEGLTAAQKAAEAKRLREEQEEKELARMNDLVSKAVGEDRKRLEEALDLVKNLDEKSKKSAELFAQTVEKQQETIVGLQDEIKSLLAAREGRSFVGDSVAKALYGTQDAFEDEVEKLVLLSYMMEKDVFETEHGKAHVKAVNGSSSVSMSSEAYETIFSTRIIRDLQKELVVGALFDELPMSRRKRLIEAHAVSIEEAFMSGNGTGQPKGLLKLAADDGAKVVTEAKADGSVLVTAKTISKLRRKLGRHGLKLSKLVLIVSMDAYYDLLEDEEWQDVAQVGNDAVKLQGQVGRIYGLPVVVSEYFPAKAASAEFAVIVYKDNFVMPRQRAVTVERERQAGKQRDAYYVTQRVNLQRYFENGVVSGAYAAS